LMIIKLYQGQRLEYDPCLRVADLFRQIFSIFALAFAISIPSIFCPSYIN
jgi:hypothetical protein